MSAGTSIEWTDTTWNPVRGCSRVSEGCRNCYAERQAARFSGPGEPFHGFARMRRGGDDLDARIDDLANGKGRQPTGPRWTGKVELVPDKLSEPLRWRKPRRVFVNSMSDLFHESLPDEAIDRVFAIMLAARWHTFQVLTKRPERMRDWISRPMSVDRYVAMIEAVGTYAPLILMEDTTMTIEGGAKLLSNVWLGVSVEDQATADERIPVLLDTPAALRFVSAEPLLGPIDFRRIRNTSPPAPGCPSGRPSAGVNWIIVGGESGPGARPCDVSWVRSIVEQCKGAGVACFVKQLGSRPYLRRPPSGAPDDDGDVYELRLKNRKGGDPSEWPADLCVREFPETFVR